MAGYLRKLISLENALKNAINDLKDEGLKEATGKSESHFRKCTDEQDLDHNIHHLDAVKLDIEFRRRKLGSPMLEVINYYENKFLNRYDIQYCFFCYNFLNRSHYTIL